MNLLKFTCRGLSLFREESLEIDFTTSKRVLTSEIEENLVTSLFNRVCKLNSLALIGINASGKSVSINVLSFILKIYIENQSIDQNSVLKNYFDDQMRIEAYLFDESTAMIYKVDSVIRKDPANNQMYFSEEHLYSKKYKAGISRATLYEFTDSDAFTRNGSGQISFLNYLKKEDSILSGILNAKTEPLPNIIDMSSGTNFNFVTTINEELLPVIINMLDPSIEKIKVVEKGTLQYFHVKFRNNPDVIESDWLSLEKYLSSGTIRGISFLSNIQSVFKQGGYLIVDEIETHFHKAIALNLIRLFNSEINRQGATLIFTTHYLEILDSITRSDSIYILSKDSRIKCDRYSDIGERVDRTDKKKSQVFLSGMFDTAPSYSGYTGFKHALKANLEQSNG